MCNSARAQIHKTTRNKRNGAKILNLNLKHLNLEFQFKMKIIRKDERDREIRYTLVDPEK